MVKLVLYHMPGACSRVTMNALEEVGCAYEDRAVALLRGEQREAAYHAINPKGKVPVLVVDGEPITENPAILFFLANRFPGAGLLPEDGTSPHAMQGLADLVWCGGTLHPTAHRFFRPGAYTGAGEEAGVKVAAEKALVAVAESVAARLDQEGWWYGARWSIIDVYLDWVFGSAAAFGFDCSHFPALMDHSARVRRRPAFQRARQREIDAVARDDLPMVPGVTL